MIAKMADIAFDSGTQIRAAIDQQVVADYAEAMTSGAKFPAIVLFHDGNRHYLADGFHRFMAAQRLQLREIDADVRPGTKEDALWFALGANREQGQRLTDTDKKHAVEMALRTWPHKMQREIAEQIGCHPSLVSHVSTKINGSETVLRGRALQTQQKRDSVRELISAGGLDCQQIAKKAKVSRTLVSDVRAEMGLSRMDNTKAGVTERRQRMSEMAAEGYSSRQIASSVGISENRTKNVLRRLGVDVPADKVIGKSKRHDSNRIVEHIVLDAENLTEGFNLIEFGDLDRSRLAEWLKSLSESRDKLGTFIRRLIKEQQKNGQAA